MKNILILFFILTSCTEETPEPNKATEPCLIVEQSGNASITLLAFDVDGNEIQVKSDTIIFNESMISVRVVTVGDFGEMQIKTGTIENGIPNVTLHSQHTYESRPQQRTILDIVL